MAATISPCHQNSVGIARQLWLLLTAHGHSKSGNTLCKVALELANGDSSILVLIGFAFQALHQVVAEDAVFQVWNGQATAYSAH